MQNKLTSLLFYFGAKLTSDGGQQMICVCSFSIVPSLNNLLDEQWILPYILPYITPFILLLALYCVPCSLCQKVFTSFYFYQNWKAWRWNSFPGTSVSWVRRPQNLQRKAENRKKIMALYKGNVTSVLQLLERTVFTRCESHLLRSSVPLHVT